MITKTATPPLSETTPTPPVRFRAGLRMAILSGLLLWLACPRLSLWPLAWVALVPLILSTIQAKGFPQALWRGYLFGCVYLGGFTWSQLARSMRVAELRAGAIARADAMFRSDRAPWCPELF